MDDTAIIAHFGGDTTDLQASVDDAAIIMKGFSRQAGTALREIGNGFIGAVVFEEAIKGFREMSEAAMETADQELTASALTGSAISAQSQAWLDMKGAVQDTGFSWTQLGETIVSIPGMAGEAIGAVINNLRGIGPAAQASYTQMANTATTTLATIKAAHDKYLADLPAATAKANDEIAKLDKEYADSQKTDEGELNDLYSERVSIANQLASTDVNSLAYKKLLIAGEQNALDIQKQEVVVAQDKLKSDQSSFAARRDMETIEEQIADLQKMQATYTLQAAAAAGNAKEQKLYQNAAEQAGLEIATRESTIRKATALSAQDQLNVFIATTPALENLNTLSQAQLQLLENQSKEKQNQYQIDQLLELGADTRNDAENKLLTTLIKQNDALTQQDAILKQVDADTAPKNTGGGGPKGPQSVGANDDTQGLVINHLDGVAGQANWLYSSGVGGVNQQYQEAQSAANAKANLQSMINNLQSQILQDQHSADPVEEAAIPALQAKIDALHQQLTQISPSNPNGTSPAAYTAPDTTKLITATNDTLTAIQSTLNKLVGG